MLDRKQRQTEGGKNIGDGIKERKTAKNKVKKDRKQKETQKRKIKKDRKNND